MNIPDSLYRGLRELFDFLPGYARFLTGRIVFEKLPV